MYLSERVGNWITYISELFSEYEFSVSYMILQHNKFLA